MILTNRQCFSNEQSQTESAVIDTSKHRFIVDEAGNRTHAIVPIADFEAMLEACGKDIVVIELNESDLLEETREEKLTIQFD